MKILLTGATGFIGKNLYKALIKNNHIVFIICRKTSNQNFCPKSNVIYADDLSEKKFDAHRFDGVIHLASLYINQHQYEDIPALIESNLVFGLKILDLSAKAGVTWFLNTGTLFQNLNSEPYNPVNLYSATKQAFQTLAEFYIKSDQIEFFTLKLNDTYGLGDTRKKIFNLWKELAESGKQMKMSLGNQLIQTLHIDDVVLGFLEYIELIKSDAVHSGNEFALIPKEIYSLKELSYIFQEVSGKKLNIDWGGYPYRNREVMKPATNVECLPNWEQKVLIKEGLALFLNEV